MIHKSFLSVIIFSSLAFSEGYWVNYGWELFDHVTDARTAALGNATTAYANQSPASTLANPIFSSIPVQRVSLTHQSRFAGLFSSELIGTDTHIRDEKSIRWNLLYEGIGQIPDTRNMLLDWGNDGQFGTNDPGEGNGILDEGERLDSDQIRYFNQRQIGIHSSFVQNIANVPLGIALKILSYYLDDHFALGIGIDFGVLKQVNTFNVGLVVKNLPASGLIWDNGTVEGTAPTVSIGAHAPYKFSKIPLELHTLFNMDLSMSKRHLDSQLQLGHISMDTALGMEMIYKRRLMVRMGRNYLGHATGGLGMSWKIISIDYAFQNSNTGTGMGSHHLVSVNILLDWLRSALILDHES